MECRSYVVFLRNIDDKFSAIIDSTLKFVEEHRLDSAAELEAQQAILEVSAHVDLWRQDRVDK